MSEKVTVILENGKEENHTLANARDLVNHAGATIKKVEGKKKKPSVKDEDVVAEDVNEDIDTDDDEDDEDKSINIQEFLTEASDEDIKEFCAKADIEVDGRWNSERLRQEVMKAYTEKVGIKKDQQDDDDE